MAVQFKDYYETLGVSKTAAAEEIRKAFRKLARQHHPDVSKDKKKAEEKFKEINEAYEVLSDPEKRSKYDTLGADWERGGAPGGFPQGRGGAGPGGYARHGAGAGEEFHFGGTGFSDFFEAFFGSGGASRGNPFGGAGFGGADFQPQSERGHDIEADLMVTFAEALHGSKRKISFRRSENAKTETYDIRIPPGVREGQRIRLAGQGEAGSRGATAGDLFLRVKFAQNPDFHAEGADLIHELSMPVWEAVLGCQKSVPTLDGRARLKIPPGTQSGRRFRLKQQGLPKEDGTRGDLYVAVEVEVPGELTAKQRALWEQLAAESKS
jgi:curved DNA-binding protein